MLDKLGRKQYYEKTQNFKLNVIKTSKTCFLIHLKSTRINRDT